MLRLNSLKTKLLFITLLLNNKLKPSRSKQLDNSMKGMAREMVIDMEIEEIINSIASKDIDKSSKDKGDKRSKKRTKINKPKNQSQRRDTKEAICQNKISQDCD